MYGVWTSKLGGSHPCICFNNMSRDLWPIFVELQFSMVL